MTAAHGYSQQKENYAKRLRRIEGQVRGIAKMIDEDKYCIDVLTQISAVNSALQSVALGLLDEHLGHCVTQAVAEGGEEADAKLAEASAAIARLVRSWSLPGPTRTFLTARKITENSSGKERSSLGSELLVAQRLFDTLHLGGELAGVAGADVGLQHQAHPG
jgi:CsoR family transcriptional regulator, copper-sensing transcriptional repressor